MLQKHIEKHILQNFKYEPSQSQIKAISLLANFIVAPENDTVFLVKGFAGTGKTSLITSLVNALSQFGLQSVLLAPTGRAAKVLNTYTQHEAYTIHKKIYRQKSSKDGFAEFVLDKNFYSNTFFIVDEASMISNQIDSASIFGSGNLLQDLLEFVYTGKNCKLILVGDTAQLPPIGTDISPALNPETFELYKFKVIEVQLSDILRQTQSSGILYNATRIRSFISEKAEQKICQTLNLNISGFSDIIYIRGHDIIKTLADLYERDGIQETVIITRSNKRANAYNSAIRKQILYHEEPISAGDMVMVVKNNYYWCDFYSDVNFIANGDIAEVKEIKKIEKHYGLQFADITLCFVDYDNAIIHAKVILDTLNINAASLNYEDNKKLFYEILNQGVTGRKAKKADYQKVRNDPYFNALQIKFAYAVTCHKAQGGQWCNVFVDHGYLTDEDINIESLRWLYTAFTRSTEKLYIINFNRNFFTEESKRYIEIKYNGLRQNTN